jgi:alcohol dehydrogenase
MRAMVIDRYGKDVPLRLAELPMPEIGEQDVLVEIHAASVNPVDYKIRDGKLRILTKYQMPLIMGCDFAGTILQIGSKVKKFKVGDEVYGRPRKTRIGTFAEYIAVHEEDLSLKPKNLSFIEAASIPLVGLTTLQAYTEVLKLHEGQKILVHAGAGGIGTFAIQLAKLMGAYVATTASEKGHDLVQSLGADEIINYRTQNFEQILKDYDAVYDTLGGDALEKSFQILKPGGKIVSIAGIPNAAFGRKENVGMLKTLLFSIVSRKIKYLEKKYKVSYHFLFMKPSGTQLEYIKHLIEQHKIKPVVDKIYEFIDTQQAIDYLETGRAKGKVVIQIK